MNEIEERTPESEAQTPRKKRTRRPQTEEEKLNAAKARAAAKEKAAALKPDIFVQFQELELNVNALSDEAKAKFRVEKKRTPITDLKLYIKPEERAACYVINEQFNGKLDF